MNKLRAILVGLMFGLALIATVRPAEAAPSAHPLGNFTVNQYSALTVEGDGIAVRYVLDEAEIPTYQELGEIRADHSSNLTAAEHDALLKSKATTLISNLQLLVNGQPVALQQRSALLSFPAGAGGLSTMRVDLQLFAPLAGAAKGAVVYRDNNSPERIGWKEIISNAGAGGTISDSTVAATDRSAALSNYPSDMLNSPPQILDASFSFTTNGVAPVRSSSNAAPVTVQPSGDWLTGRMDALTQVMTQGDLPFDGLLVALLIAFVLGGAHALSPGHGKTVAAAYLVGSRGTPFHAFLLGLSVTITHTIGVFALGLITMFAAQYILPEQLFPWITFASGVILVLMGLGLFTARLQGLRERGIALLPRLSFFSRPTLAPALAGAPLTAVQHGGTEARRDIEGHYHSHGGDHVHDHDHSHDHDHPHDHDHDHDHPHDHDHGHDHGQLAQVADAEAMHRHLPWGKSHSHVPAPTPAHSHGPGEVHSHDHAEAEHKHYPWGKAHSHVPTDKSEASIGSLIALGASGGLLPCPSALIVMLSAISFNRIGLGIILIIAFSVGLAAVLTGIGMLFLYARKLVEKAPIGNVWLQRLPVASALAVAGLGLVIAIQALSTVRLFS